jgi:hypothetical protein
VGWKIRFWKLDKRVDISIKNIMREKYANHKTIEINKISRVAFASLKKSHD